MKTTWRILLAALCSLISGGTYADVFQVDFYGIAVTYHRLVGGTLFEYGDRVHASFIYESNSVLSQRNTDYISDAYKLYGGTPRNFVTTSYSPNSLLLNSSFENLTSHSTPFQVYNHLNGNYGVMVVGQNYQIADHTESYANGVQTYYQLVGNANYYNDFDITKTGDYIYGDLYGLEKGSISYSYAANGLTAEFSEMGASLTELKITRLDSTVPVPEPDSAIIFLGGLLSLIALRWRTSH